jgi:hypothetical protein
MSEKKKIQPKQPAKTDQQTSTDRTADRKSARKTGVAKPRF